jgi:hypothetical protein
MESFYSINLWIDERSINQLLIRRGFAIEYDDSQYPEVREKFHRSKNVCFFFHF